MIYYHWKLIKLYYFITAFKAICARITIIGSNKANMKLPSDPPNSFPFLFVIFLSFNCSSSSDSLSKSDFETLVA